MGLNYCFKQDSCLGCAGSWLPHGLVHSCSVQASLCGGFSGCRVWALGHLGFGSCDTFLSSWGFQALEHRLKSSDLWAQLLCGMLDLP